MNCADRDRLPPAPKSAAENYSRGRYPMPTAAWARIQLALAEGDRLCGAITAAELRQIRRKAKAVIAAKEE